MTDKQIFSGACCCCKEAEYDGRGSASSSRLAAAARSGKAKAAPRKEAVDDCDKLVCGTASSWCASQRGLSSTVQIHPCSGRSL
jgi:hypothetical protein